MAAIRRVDDYITPHRDRTALLTIDLQVDFSTPGAVGEVEGTATAMGCMRTVVEAFRAARRPIVHVIRLYRADGSNVDLSRRRSFEEDQRVAVIGSTGAELANQLLPNDGCKLDPQLLLENSLQEWAPNEWCMFKPRWSAFYNTPLDDHLRALNVDTVAVIGCNFPNSPKTTLYNGGQRDYRVILIQDAVSRCRPLHIREARLAGMTATSARRCAQWITGGRHAL